MTELGCDIQAVQLPLQSNYWKNETVLCGGIPRTYWQACKVPFHALTSCCVSYFEKVQKKKEWVVAIAIQKKYFDNTTWNNTATGSCIKNLYYADWIMYGSKGTSSRINNHTKLKLWLNLKKRQSVMKTLTRLYLSIRDYTCSKDIYDKGIIGILYTCS